MKICMECDFYKRATLQAPDGRVGMADICVNSECRDPVDGSPLPCQVARQQVAFCGIDAKHYRQKKEAPKKEASVIQLS